MATEAGMQPPRPASRRWADTATPTNTWWRKIKRDVRITTIYEGTSEIMEMTISRDRWQLHLKTRGQHYHEQSERSSKRCTPAMRDVGADSAALALHALAEGDGEDAA
jgi:hypothetical protein